MAVDRFTGSLREIRMTAEPIGSQRAVLTSSQRSSVLIPQDFERRSTSPAGAKPTWIAISRGSCNLTRLMITRTTRSSGRPGRGCSLRRPRCFHGAPRAGRDSGGELTWLEEARNTLSQRSFGPRQSAETKLDRPSPRRSASASRRAPSSESMPTDRRRSLRATSASGPAPRRGSEHQAGSGSAPADDEGSSADS